MSNEIYDWYGKVPRNPSLVNDKLSIVSGRDFGEKRTVEHIATKLMAVASIDGADEFADEIDRLFLYGCWKCIVERLPYDGRLFLADIRGLMFILARRARSAEEGLNDLPSQ